mmetsp:Transcript_46905/g.117539  ORF Transcript_46905/g.117539 Transcript_46905/m.117539 type:complete len:511 (+) Transcript_46905:196-1728(+)
MYEEFPESGAPGSGAPEPVPQPSVSAVEDSPSSAHQDISGELLARVRQRAWKLPSSATWGASTNSASMPRVLQPVRRHESGSFEAQQQSVAASASPKSTAASPTRSPIPISPPSLRDGAAPLSDANKDASTPLAIKDASTSIANKDASTPRSIQSSGILSPRSDALRSPSVYSTPRTAPRRQNPTAARVVRGVGGQGEGVESAASAIAAFSQPRASPAAPSVADSSPTNSPPIWTLVSHTPPRNQMHAQASPGATPDSSKPHPPAHQGGTPTSIGGLGMERPEGGATLLFPEVSTKDRLLPEHSQEAFWQERDSQDRHRPESRHLAYNPEHFNPHHPDSRSHPLRGRGREGGEGATSLDWGEGELVFRPRTKGEGSLIHSTGVDNTVMDTDLGDLHRVPPLFAPRHSPSRDDKALPHTEHEDQGSLEHLLPIRTHLSLHQSTTQPSFGANAASPTPPHNPSFSPQGTPLSKESPSNQQLQPSTPPSDPRLPGMKGYGASALEPPPRKFRV